MAENESTARIKINKLFEEAGWQFFDDKNGQANIRLEPNIKIMQTDLDAFGNDFETIKNGFIDFLLFDEQGFPFIIIEAKPEDKNPLIGKKQALVNANKELISLFEQKIKDKIAMSGGTDK